MTDEFMSLSVAPFLMLSKKNRFTGPLLLRWRRLKPQKIITPVGVICFRQGERFFGTRAAIIISKKTCKSAVVRNRLRRLYYNTLRQLLTPALLAQAWQMVLIYRPTNDNNQTKDIMEKIFHDFFVTNNFTPDLTKT